MPTRFSGSAPESDTRAPDSGLRRPAQQADRIRQGELLAGKAGDETAAADLAARLEPAVDPQQVAPRRQPRRLALEQPPEHDAPAAQQGVGQVLDGVGPVLL